MFLEVKKVRTFGDVSSDLSNTYTPANTI